jgi:flagellar biogenesis protein FliO
MFLGKAILLVLLIVFVAWLLGGLMRGRPERGRAERARRRSEQGR